MSEAVRLFEDRAPALNAYVDRLERDNQVEKAVCYTDAVWLTQSEDSPPVELGDERLKEYLALCHAAGAALTWRVDNGYLLYYGADSRAGRDFNIAFIWQIIQADGRPQCSSVTDLRDFGMCVVPLSDNWVLDYEWMPSDYESPREKAVMELAEDVARKELVGPPPEH